VLIAGTTSGRASRPQQYENGWDAPYQNPNNWTPNPYQNWEGWPPPAHAGEVGQNLVNWRTGVLPDAGSTKEQPVLHRPFFIRRTLIFCKLCPNLRVGCLD
jgi:hypothetical protein